MEKLKNVIVENGITYVLGTDDLYYQDLRLPEGTHYQIGKYGHMRCEYLKEFEHGYYMELLLQGKLNEHLHEVDEECYEMLDHLVEQMKKKQSVTEQLKVENQMIWVRKMNNIMAFAEGGGVCLTERMDKPTFRYLRLKNQGKNDNIN